MEQWKAKWAEHWLKIMVGGFFTLLILLFTQQGAFNAELRNDIKDNRIHTEQIVAVNSKRVESAFKEKCTTIDKNLENKVDNKSLMRALEIIEIKQDIDIQKWEEQKEFNKEARRNFKEINKNIIILNERMK